jgi:hypothetical protein
VAQKFDPISFTVHQSDLNQRSFIHDAAFLESFEIPDVDYGKVFSEDIGKPALGQPAMQWHLTAFVSGPDTAAGSGIVSFCSSTGSFPGA